MRLHRLITILLLLESREKIKARELAEALETSVRTIQRDIDILGESGIPIVAETGPYGGYKLMKGYTSNLNTFHHDEIINLYLCGIGVRMYDHIDAGINLKGALLKLENILPAEYVIDIKKAKQRFFFDPEPWWKEKLVIDDFEVIRKAVWQSIKIDIEYKDQKNNISRRVVRPYGLVVKDMYWYLVAFCEKRNDLRAFKCDRINKVCLLEDVFKIPEDFSLENYWEEKSKRFKEDKTIEWKKKHSYSKKHPNSNT